MLIKRNCGMRAWYHLAFVLDTQMSLVQGKLIVWVAVTMCFRVVHFGTLVTELLLQVLIASVANAFFDRRCRLHIPISLLRLNSCKYGKYLIWEQSAMPGFTNVD